MIKKIVFICSIIFLCLVGYVSYQIGYCRLYLKGVDTSELKYLNGVAYLIGDSVPYTGTAYSSVCGGECGLWCLSLHWRAEFKEGLFHGRFDAPLSGVADGQWFSPGDDTATYIYQNGARVK